MRLFVKIILPLIVLAASIWGAQQVIANKPQAQRRPAPPTRVTVEARRLVTQDYQIQIKSHGTAQPRTESTLIPEVSGRIVAVSPSFRNGGFFEQGEELLQIDPRDYEISVTIAQAQVAEARMALEEAQAQAEVAQRDWQQHRRGAAARQLALRKPQLNAAQAVLASATAQLQRAELALERTRITAPYVGRVLEQNAGLGQYVSSGTILAKIYAIDNVEIRLPLTNRQLEYITIPEQFRNQSQTYSEPHPSVTLIARIGQRDYRWQGQILRAEGAIDTRSRQLFVIAQVADPYAKGPQDRPPLRVGQFVDAVIEGRLLRDVFVIPRAALREGQQVLLADADQRLQRRSVTVAWSDEQDAVISAGLTAGEMLILTPFTGAISGMPVKLKIDAEPVTRTRPSQNAVTATVAVHE